MAKINRTLRDRRLRNYYDMLRTFDYDKNGMYHTLTFLATMMDLVAKEYYDDDDKILNIEGIKKENE